MNLDEIKHDRLSEPRRFLMGVFNGLEEYENEKYQDSFLYKKDGKVMFEYNSKYQLLFYSYLYIWIGLSKDFELDYQEIHSLIQSMVENNLKLVVSNIYLKQLN